MAAREPVKRAVKQVKPLLSTDREEARRRVLNLYRAWYRQIPYIGKHKCAIIPNGRLLCKIVYNLIDMNRL